MLLKHYVEFLFPGIFLCNSCEVEIPERNIEAFSIPDNACGFRYFDRYKSIIDGEVAFGPKRNISPITFFGKIYTLNQVKQQFPYQQTLINNMIINNWKYVVRTKFGNWYPINKDEIVITF